jgi:hypothetical protein
MPALAASTRFNVEATLNAWLNTAINGITLPSHLSTLPAFVYNWDEVAATMPCFAIQHIPAGMLNDIQGRVVGNSQSGRRALGIMEVSCFVSRKGNPSWNGQLRTMRDLVETAVTSAGTVVISDYSTPATPTSTAFKIDILDVTETPTEADPNPNIQRARVLISYAFIYRAESQRTTKSPGATAWEEVRALGNVILLDALPNGTLIGRSATSQQILAYSTDEGANWTDTYYTTHNSNKYFPSVIVSGRVMGDGSFVVWLYNGTVYRSPNPLTTSFALVATSINTPAKNPTNAYGHFVYGQYAMYNEYGAEPADNAYFSDDYGSTWSRVFTLPADAVPGDQHHMHNVVYDKYDDMLWTCAGDTGNRMIYFSLNRGTTWSQLGAFGSMSTTGNMIQIIPLPEGILFTTDHSTAGTYRLARLSDRSAYTVSDFALVQTVATVTGALPVGSRPVVVYGDDACTYFSFEFFDSSHSNALSHIYATRNGLTFFDIAAPTYTPTGSGTFGVECLCGPCTNGYIYGQHMQGSARYLIRFSAPTWS